MLKITCNILIVAKIILRREPLKCYVMQMEVGGVIFSGEKRYEGVRFNVISFTRGWVGGPISRKKRYITLEWPQRYI